MKTGLALSGGGSLGAYEAGVVKALAELGAKIDIIAGTSIGALNGAVLASAPTLAAGSRQMLEIWRNLAAEDIFKTNYFGLFTLLASLGAPLSSFASLVGQKIPQASLCSSEPVKNLLERAIIPENFDCGPPFYVGVAKITQFAEIKFFAALLGLGNTDAPVWLHIQKFPVAERLKAVIASAAIPVIFSPQQFGQDAYMDGGVADWLGETGNTPVEPLVNSGCNAIIAILLNRSSLYNRLRHSGAAIIEIRPQKAIYCEPSLRTIITFNQSRILQAIDDGYEDCMKKMREIKAVLAMEIEHQNAMERFEQSVRSLDESRARMQDVMDRIRKRD